MTVELVYAAAVICFIPALIFALYAQVKVYFTFDKYLDIHVQGSMTASQLAERLLAEHHCDVRVEMGRTRLGDHYDPRRKVVSLSPEVYGSNSVAAYSIAAHEVGHAVQDEVGYAPLKIRHIVIKSTSVINNMLMPLILIGMFAQIFLATSDVFWFWFLLGLIITYGISTLINVITLPTEFNASSRAREMLRHANVMEESELRAAGKVLYAAALTYVAALVVSLIYLVRYVALFIMLADKRRK